MPRAKQRTPELRQRVVQVAVDTLAAEGVAGFTTRRVAEGASTSTPAVYELFTDKAGLVREVFFEGFRMLGATLARLPVTDDPRADLVAVASAFRRFARRNPQLTQLMFSRPFAAFDPAPAEREAGRAVRELIVDRVRRGIEAGLLAGDPTDVAHVLLALVQGLATAEGSSRLGTSARSVNRRWELAIDAALRGLAPLPPAPSGTMGR